jgi:hypothetical protein
MPGYNGTATSTVAYSTSTYKFGTASAQFPTTNITASPAYILLPTGPGTNADVWTWECWFKSGSGVAPTAIQIIIGAGSPSGASLGYIGIAANTGYPIFNIYNPPSNGTTITGSASICDGNWHHLAFVANGASGIQAFVDGTSIGTSAELANGQGTGSTMTFGTLNTSTTGNNFPLLNSFIDEVAIWHTAEYTANFTPRTTPYTGTEGMVALYHLDSNAQDSSGTAVQIAPNNAAIVYSPYNWTPASSVSASSINSGAYFRTLFSGSSVALNFNVTNNDAPLSEIYYRIDGYEAQTPWTVATVAATITPEMPTNTTQYPYHLLEVVVKSTSQTINRWNSPSNTAVVFTGLTLAPSATVLQPKVLPTNYLIFGDSITEGVRTVNQTAANDPDQNDVMQEWSWHLGKALGGEFGIVGFGSQGFTVGGSGNVPVFGTAYTSIMAGVTRAFSPAPNAVIINMGSNDGSSPGSVQADCEAVVEGLLAASPTSKIVIMEPFGATSVPPISSLAAVATALEAAVTTLSNGQVTFLPTTGFLVQADGIDSTGFHPTGANASALVAPQVIGAILPTFQSAARSYVFGPN